MGFISWVHEMGFVIACLALTSIRCFSHLMDP